MISQRFKTAKRSTQWAWCLTIVWVVGVVLVICVALHDTSNTSVFDVATFVAISCSIPTLIWLLKGYYDQGQELQRQEGNFRKQLSKFQEQTDVLTCQNKVLTEQNSVLNQQKNVLRQQTGELKKQAMNTARLADTAISERDRVQKREERQAEPILIPGIDEPEGALILRTNFINRGGRMRDIVFEQDERNRLNWSPESVLGTNELAKLTVIVDPEPTYPIGFTVIGRDDAGYKHTFKFERPMGKPWRQFGHQKTPISEMNL